MSEVAEETIPHVTEEALGLLPERVILLGFRGSVVHGTYRPSSDPNSVDDIDLMAVHVGPLEHYLGFRRKGQETLDRSSGPWDVVSYEIRHYFALLRKNNPNVQQLLWTPERFIVRSTELGDRLREHRRLFLSKQAFDAFNGYAYSQFKKLEKKDHRGYMGQKRKKLVELHGYDTKYAAHLIRLIRMGCEYLRYGEVVLPRPDADELLAIKDGEWTLQEVRQAAKAGFAALREAKEDSPLPARADQEAIERLLMDTVAGFHGLTQGTPEETT